MDYIQPEHQHNNYFMGAFDYPFWQEGEPWDGFVESYNPEFSSPFNDKSPGSSFDGAMHWADGSEPLYYTQSPVSPITPPVATTNAPNPKLVVETQAKPQEPANPNPKPKRKRSQTKAITKSTNTTNSKPKRACRSRSRSTSFSPRAINAMYNHLRDKADQDGNNSNDNEKEDVYLERSRVASNKFRERKRNEIAQLESEEYTIEDSNRQLRSMLDSLTSEILSLKMQLLQHTDCNCELIQAYITKEAQHFVKNLEGVANA